MMKSSYPIVCLVTCGFLALSARLFLMVANEEQQIRQNPVARTTQTLQKVFGALKN